MTAQANSSDNPKKLTDAELDKLTTENMVELNKMSVSAGSMVKALIMELKRKNRDTYLRLYDPVKDGHVVYYEFVQGEKELISKLVKRLGFKQCTDNLLEVAGGK